MDLNKFLEGMLALKASDLYITVGAPILFRVDGELRPQGDKLSENDVALLLDSAMDPERRQEFRKSRESNFAIVRDCGRFRVSAFFQRELPGAVIRRIETNIPTFEQLKLPLVLQDLAIAKRGLVLVVGATGSGKSTTMAAMTGYRNNNKTGHILTVEDPIEFVHEHKRCIVTQREVGLDTDSYEVALKNSLRQAPDMILIGEIRSRETMEYAMTFAETGHLCMATLHANNANQALERILHLGLPRQCAPDQSWAAESRPQNKPAPPRALSTGLGMFPVFPDGTLCPRLASRAQIVPEPRSPARGSCCERSAQARRPARI